MFTPFAVLLAQMQDTPRPEEPNPLIVFIGLMCELVVILAITIPVLAGLWKVFVKAGQPGWAAIVPIYNYVVLLQITKKPVWWVVLFFIPCVNVIAAFVVGWIVSMEIAKAFGKGAGFGIGLFFLGFIFYPILGFGSAQFVGLPGDGALAAAPPMAPPRQQGIQRPPQGGPPRPPQGGQRPPGPPRR